MKVTCVFYSVMDILKQHKIVMALNFLLQNHFTQYTLYLL